MSHSPRGLRALLPLVATLTSLLTLLLPLSLPAEAADSPGSLGTAVSSAPPASTGTTGTTGTASSTSTASRSSAIHGRRAATRVSGWQSAPRTASPGTPWQARVQVSGGRRPVLLERQDGARWAVVARVRTDGAGLAALRFRPPARTAAVVLRVRVPATARTAAARTTAHRVAILTDAPDAAVPSTDDDELLAEVLRLVNQARSQSRTCGSTTYPAAPPLTREGRLDRAAQAYAERMAREDFFEHSSPDGDDPGDRLTAERYPWRTWAENIGAGYSRPESVVQAWLDSTGHCANLMSQRVTEIGLGRAEDPDSYYGTYWVQDFGTR